MPERKREGNMADENRAPIGDETSGPTLRSARALHAAGLIDAQRCAEVARVETRYEIAVTPAMAALIDTQDAQDPIARQFIPSAAELVVSAGERADPIGDRRHSPVAGIVHRYPDRVLLKPLLVCPVYCRFCFRRESVGADGGVLPAAALDRALAYIADHKEIWEVILSGGDPLILAPARLAAIIARLDAIDHVAVIRIHTRVPVVAPALITASLVAALGVETPVYVVLHCNHARELTAAARAACRRLVAAGLPMLAQTVLLKGVNDDAPTMAALLRALVANRIKPYYLHHGDLAPGTAHFRTTIAAGQELMRMLRGRLSGLCQPSYTLDIPGGFGKVPIGPGHIVEDACGGLPVIVDNDGVGHRYPAAADDGAAAARPRRGVASGGAS
jgi:lysine 2,3-aminomutase